MSKKSVLTGLVLVSLLLMISFASAGFWDSIKASITGQATSAPTNVSVTISGTNIAQITYVQAIPAVTPLEATSKTIVFNVTVYDPDGFFDINFSSVGANFSKTGEPTRVTPSCSNTVNYSTNYANFSCSIDIWYFDGNGAWTVNVKARDNGNLTWAYNTSTSFTFNQLKALVITPPALTWSSLSTGAQNQTSNNDPTIINNTGNYNGTIDLTALNLIGETISSNELTASNFTTGITTGAGNPECMGTQLANATLKTIVGSTANRGNLSLGAGAGQANFYYCIPLVPNLPSQIYSTTASGSWTISY